MSELAFERTSELQCSAVESVPVVVSIWAALDANNEAFFVGHDQAHLYAEFIGPVRLPLRDTFDFGRMKAVALVFGLQILLNLPCA